MWLDKKCKENVFPCIIHHGYLTVSLCFFDQSSPCLTPADVKTSVFPNIMNYLCKNKVKPNHQHIWSHCSVHSLLLVIHAPREKCHYASYIFNYYNELYRWTTYVKRPSIVQWEFLRSYIKPLDPTIDHCLICHRLCLLLILK